MLDIWPFSMIVGGCTSWRRFSSVISYPVCLKLREIVWILHQCPAGVRIHFYNVRFFPQRPSLEYLAAFVYLIILPIQRSESCSFTFEARNSKEMKKDSFLSVFQKFQKNGRTGLEIIHSPIMQLINELTGKLGLNRQEIQNITSMDINREGKPFPSS